MRRRRLLVLSSAALVLAVAGGCNTVKISSAYEPPAEISAVSLPGAVVFRWSAASGADAYVLHLSALEATLSSGSGITLDSTVQSFREPTSVPLFAEVITQHGNADGSSKSSAASAVVSAAPLPLPRFATLGIPLPDGIVGFAEFGYDVAVAGDVNGDGDGDALVGAPGTGSGAGAIVVYSGANDTAFLTVSGSAGATLGWTLAGPGDAQGNGKDDVFASAPGAAQFTIAYDGQATLRQDLAEPADYDQSALVADLNDDGFADLLLGDPSESGAAGTIELREGSANGLPAAPTATISSSTEPIGHALGAGDFDGDGKSDLLIGAWGGGTQNEGEICFAANLLGAAPAPVCTLGVQSNGRLGDAIAVLGDVNGDGRDDALVADYPEDGIRSVQLWLGTNAAAGVHRSSWTRTLGSDQLTASNFPMHHLVAAAADLDGDGAPDAFVGDPGHDVVYLFLGSAGSLSQAPAQTFDDPAGTGTDEFGDSVAYGNLDGDRQPDLLVGAPGGEAAYVFQGLPSSGPVVDAGPPVSVGVSGNVPLATTFYDPSGKPGEASCSIDWGDQDVDAFSCASGPSTHTYDAVGVYHPRITVTTADGRAGMAATTVRVR